MSWQQQTWCRKAKTDVEFNAQVIKHGQRTSDVKNASAQCKFALGRKYHNASTGVSPGSSREGDDEGGSKKKMAVPRQRILRSALDKAGEVALRLTLEVSAGVKAFDGPPLKPRDVKDLFLRNFRVRVSTSEAEALIVNFTTAVIKVWT